jgi:hypothetical protein
MNIQQVSSGAGGNRNEDLIAIMEHDGCVDIVIMDGATSVADHDYVDAEAGDVVWFVSNFAAALAELTCHDTDQAEAVLRALDRLHARFDERTRGQHVPLYAHPLAALAWIRITQTAGGARLDLYCLGDCKIFLHTPGSGVHDLDPWVNPQEAVLGAAIDALAKAGVSDAVARRERLLPMLRSRREEQNTARSPEVLCLRPNGPFAARRSTLQAAPGAMLLAMTDGFSRIVDTYQLYSIEQVARRCLQGELTGLLAELREFEAAQSSSASLAVKRSDDASALAVRIARPAEPVPFPY